MAQHVMENPGEKSLEEEEPPMPTAVRDVLELQKAMIDLVDANDMKGFEAQVAKDAVLRSLLDPNKAATGRDKIMSKVGEIAGKLKGRLSAREVAQVTTSCARCSCTVRVMGTTVVIGFEFLFAGEYVIDLGLAKGPPPGFLTAPPPAAAVKTNDDAASVATTTTTTAAPAEEAPPQYLVPRPVAFPPRVVEVMVGGLAAPLKSPYLVPRVLNPYVKVSIGSFMARTKVLVNTKAPDWRHSTVLRLVLPVSGDQQDADDNNIRLDVVVMDMNAIRKNQWLAKGSLALATLSACDAPARVAVPLDVRKTITSQECVAGGSQALTLDVADYDVRRWWALAERSARAAADEAKTRAAEAEEARKAAEAAGGETTGGGGVESSSTGGAPQPPQTKPRWWHMW